MPAHQAQFAGAHQAEARQPQFCLAHHHRDLLQRRPRCLHRAHRRPPARDGLLHVSAGNILDDPHVEPEAAQNPGHPEFAGNVRRAMVQPDPGGDHLVIGVQRQVGHQFHEHELSAGLQCQRHCGQGLLGLGAMQRLNRHGMVKTMQRKFWCVRTPLLDQRAPAQSGAQAALVGQRNQARIGLVAGDPHAKLAGDAAGRAAGAGAEQQQAGRSRQAHRVGEVQQLRGAAREQEPLAPQCLRHADARTRPDRIVVGRQACVGNQRQGGFGGLGGHLRRVRMPPEQRPHAVEQHGATPPRGSMLTNS